MKNETYLTSTFELQFFSLSSLHRSYRVTSAQTLAARFATEQRAGRNRYDASRKRLPNRIQKTVALASTPQVPTSEEFGGIQIQSVNVLTWIIT